MFVSLAMQTDLIGHCGTHGVAEHKFAKKNGVHAPKYVAQGKRPSLCLVANCALRYIPSFLDGGSPRGVVCLRLFFRKKDEESEERPCHKSKR